MGCGASLHGNQESVKIEGPVLCAIGGLNELGDASNSMEIYNLLTDSWVPMKKRMSESRQGCGVAAVRGKIYVVGGLDRSGNPLNTMEMYDPVLDSWTMVKEPMKQSRFYCGVAVVDEQLYVVGGKNESGTALNTMEVYDPATDTWKQIHKRMGECRQGCAVAVLGGKIHVIGGVNEADDPLTTIEVFDPTPDSKEDHYEKPWTQMSAPLNECRVNCGVAVVEEKLYVIGGCNEDGNRLNTMEIFDPVFRTWSKVRNCMSQPRQRCGVAVFQDKICVIGGLGKREPLNTMEVYDIPAGAWTLVPDKMSQCRCGMVAVYLEPVEPVAPTEPAMPTGAAALAPTTGKSETAPPIVAATAPAGASESSPLVDGGDATPREKPLPLVADTAAPASDGSAAAPFFSASSDSEPVARVDAPGGEAATPKGDADACAGLPAVSQAAMQT
jgi:N-acetylneuraminic acid mutarotase